MSGPEELEPRLRELALDIAYAVQLHLEDGQVNDKEALVMLICMSAKRAILQGVTPREFANMARQGANEALREARSVPHDN